jgi:hypothetical protein
MNSNGHLSPTFYLKTSSKEALFPYLQLKFLVRLKLTLWLKTRSKVYYRCSSMWLNYTGNILEKTNSQKVRCQVQICGFIIIKITCQKYP